MPILYQLHQNKEILNFTSSEVSYDQNTTTIITGKNSVGKSRLLRSIIIDCLQSDLFNNIIAISNTQYHKFPSYRDISNNRFSNTYKYKRLAFEARPSPIRYSSEYYRRNNITLPYDSFIHNFLYQENIRFLFKTTSTNLNFLECIDFFIEQLSENYEIKLTLLKILNFLSMDDFIRCEVSHIGLTKSFQEINKKIEEYLESEDNIEYTDLNNLLLLKESILSYRELRNFSLLNLDKDQLRSLSFLIKNGLIKTRKVTFSKNKNLLNYNDLSSGELAILSLILSLASTIQNDSVICIDEPELNLHPEWQEKIIQLIEIVSNNYSGCHFFIATHSPQIISGANSNNTFILDLSRNRTNHISKFKHKSSDFQLSEAFNFPGNNNEYLIRKLIVILNKINNEEDLYLDDENFNLLNHVKKLIENNKIDKDDKASIIFNLIKSYGV